MKKIEVAFDTCFESDTVVAIQLGRLHIGEHVARFVFSPKGKTALVISRKAIEDGSLIFTDTSAVFGFGKGETMSALELPKYRCRKEVRAAKIVDIADGGRLTLDVSPAIGVIATQDVTPGPAWVNRHNPEVGMWYVVYADGYASCSPDAAFTDGYTRIE